MVNPGLAIAAIPACVGLLRLEKDGEYWILGGLLQLFACYQMSVLSKTDSYFWYSLICLLTGIAAISYGITGFCQGQRAKGVLSGAHWLLVIPAAIACYLISGGLYIDWSPFDTAYYFNHNFTADQLACATARDTVTEYSLQCTWVYAAAQFTLGLKQTTTIADARLFVATSAGLLSLSVGVLVYRLTSTIWPGLLGQALLLALLGWHEFSFIQSNGTNGYMIGLCCCYLAVATFASGSNWDKKRVVFRVIRPCLVLASIWASYLAHPQTTYTWFALAGGLSTAFLVRAWGTKRLVLILIVISFFVLGAANISGLDWFSANHRDWERLVHDGEILTVRLPGRDFMGYLPWLKPFSDPAYGFWVALVASTTAAVLVTSDRQLVIGGKRASLMPIGFLFAPIVVVAIWILPPWSELYIRSVPGEFNTISRSIWGASAWIALPIAINTILQRIQGKSAKKVFAAATALTIAPIFIPLSWGKSENVFRAKTLHLFERSTKYGGIDVEKELVPALREYCSLHPHGAAGLVMLADGYVTDFSWNRSCATATPLDRMNLFERRYLEVQSPIAAKPGDKTREEHVQSELMRYRAAIVILRKSYPGYTSSVAKRSGLWDADLAEQMAHTNIRLIDRPVLEKTGFKLYKETRSFWIYTKTKAT